MTVAFTTPLYENPYTFLCHDRVLICEKDGALFKVFGDNPVITHSIATRAGARPLYAFRIKSNFPCARLAA